MILHVGPLASLSRVGRPWDSAMPTWGPRVRGSLSLCSVKKWGSSRVAPEAGTDSWIEKLALSEGQPPPSLLPLASLAP